MNPTNTRPDHPVTDPVCPKNVIRQPDPRPSLIGQLGSPMSDDIFTREARDNPDSHNSEQDLPLDNGNLDKPFSHECSYKLAV
jgi:hypothetical protein